VLAVIACCAIGAVARSQGIAFTQAAHRTGRSIGLQTEPQKRNMLSRNG
jgi:hypothetical protein